MNKSEILKSFQLIPGVGKSIAIDLWNLGYRSIGELRGENPEKMYLAFENLLGTKVDRCLLYVFRCAVYFAENDRHDLKKLKWWNWSDDHLSKSKPKTPKKRK